MAHPIYVCLEHKLTFHTEAVAARHAVKHGIRNGWSMQSPKLFVFIGYCTDSGCGKNRLLPASAWELDEANRKIKDAEEVTNEAYRIAHGWGAK